MDHVDELLAQWNRERPDLDVAPMGLIGRMLRTTRHLSREMAATLADYDLNAASFDVLATLRRSGKPYRLSAGELMAAMMVSSGTTTNRIDQLEKVGLIERMQDPADGRGVLIQLTGKGLDLIDAAIAAHVATQARLVASLSEAERTSLDSLLRRFLEAFEQG